LTGPGTDGSLIDDHGWRTGAPAWSGRGAMGAVRTTAAALVTGACALVLTGCTTPTSSAPPPPPASPTTVTVTTAPGSSSAGEPVVSAFSVIPDLTCSGTTASVPMAWSTRDAQSVEFEVDGAPVPAGAGYPLRGTGNVTVPCDGREHEVTLVAAGTSGRAEVARHVNTATSPPPVGAPVVARFQVLEDVTCPGGTVEVAASWVTQNAQAVTFSVDGQPLPAAAGFPTTGTGNIAVPCDGTAHKVTLTATGTGPAAASSRSVNTAVSTSPTSTTPSVTASTTPSVTASATAVPTTR
jgi:hypothetical protein